METKLQTAPHLAETGRRAKRLTAVGRFAAVVAVLAGLLAWGLVLNVNTGSVQIPAGAVFRMVWDALRLKVMEVFTGGAYAEALQAVLDGALDEIIDALIAYYQAQRLSSGEKES